MNEPKTKLQGLTFLPVPEFSDAEIAFGAKESAYFPRHNRPEVPSKFEVAASRLFFEGGKWPEFGADVDSKKARRAIGALLHSWTPAHEAKISTVAYALWVWSPEAAEERAVTALSGTD